MAASLNLFFLFFFLICSLARSSDVKNEDFMSSIEDTMESKFGEYANSLASWLKTINDKRLVNSDVGRMLHYQELEPKVEKAGSAVEGRNMKKMSAVLPLVFQLGMTSAWMLLTTLLTAKSVAIGLTLLVMKIAVGSAKLASYFTAWKHKQHHYEYVPHHEHHGHKRSVRSVESHVVHPDWHGYSPEHSQSSPYVSHESSPYYASPHDASSSPYYAQAYGEYEYPAESKKAQEKNSVDADVEAISKTSKESNNEVFPSREQSTKIRPYPHAGHWKIRDSDDEDEDELFN